MKHKHATAQQERRIMTWPAGPPPCMISRGLVFRLQL